VCAHNASLLLAKAVLRYGLSSVNCTSGNQLCSGFNAKYSSMKLTHLKIKNHYDSEFPGEHSSFHAINPSYIQYDTHHADGPSVASQSHLDAGVSIFQDPHRQSKPFQD
jgi:hypothetical protein